MILAFFIVDLIGRGQCGTTGIRETDWAGHSIRGMMRRMQHLMAKANLRASVLLDGVEFGWF